MSTSITPPKLTVLIIGAYGLIGCGVAQRLLQDGHTIIGLGRDTATGKRVLPDIDWRISDLRSLTDADAWQPFLDGIDAVVNCSGALQDGPEDDLETLQHLAVSALAQGCTSADVHLVQISAAGADVDASTPFLASKARGDAAIQSTGVKHHIFRPGLVLARHSYGGTTMLRMLAAIPLIQPIATPDAKIQTVALDDVAATVSAAFAGKIPNGFVGDLVEDETHSLRDVVTTTRHWLGFAPAKHEITMPNPLMRATSKIADGLGRLMWRSPLRTTAVKVLEDGVTGTPSDLSQFGAPPVKSLTQTFAGMPARAEDRLFARMALLTPILLATLVVFWFLSGVIGFIKVQDAARVLTDVGWPRALAISSVLFWGVVDIAIAAAFLYRPSAKMACWAAIAVSLFYLAASTLFVPHLWLDPLGPMIKVLPSIALALVARIALETR
ncbi:SDR family oxidoreductase [Octadecabacter sp. 1_MG-2023]|uniref:SDR family oxidoreductase n=1 Tax=unclassified Octadecabacter TaxID=196158 RepID=UPI001C09DD49|nr:MULTISPECIES: SDR family oxidoreductase [unclassified Octadecabacter]MBU2994362.1 SDR family oxidoreductase [Octadecabacter sp. B2R22]MDO6734349.1 SDR family oxidoreductase [Octadecabacter sp. 1_MG-2023]